jgi:hypothetical protein
VANPRGFSQTGIELLNAELAKRGIGPAAASGAIAGIMGESGANLDPTSFNAKDPGGGSGGIGQWNRERLIGPTGMLAFARNAGVPVDINTPTDAKKVPLAVQAQYLGHELDTRYAGVAKQLQGAATPQDALNIWVKSYESPLDTQGAIRQRSQYLAPVATALNSSRGTPPTPGTTINTTGQPAQAQGGLAGALPGFTPNSPGAKMTAAGLQQLAGGGSQGDQGENKPPDMPSPPMPMGQAVGGPMMLGPGGQNTFGARAAQQALAQQGFLMQPSLAANLMGGVRPPVPSTLQSTIQAQPIGMAAGVPGLPGTTLNSPSQLQMALMTGAMNPYDLYSSGAYGLGSS